MAQALRRLAPARRAGIAAGVEAVSVAGTYNIDLKITVEWQRELSVGEIEAELLGFLGEAQSFRDIRVFLSGFLRASDDALLPGKISKYRVSPGSLRALLDALEARGTIAREADETDSPKGVEPRWLATGKPAEGRN